MVAHPSDDRFRPAWSDAELPVRSRGPLPSDYAERRRSGRYGCDLLALVDPLVEGRPATRVTKVADLSGDGLGLVAAKPYPEGSVLWLELVDRAGHSYSKMRARLVHATRQDDGDWRLGCQVLPTIRKPA